MGELENLQLIQLHGNRITKIPDVPKLENSIFEMSAFVTDCGVPSVFDEPLECENCTMCCESFYAPLLTCL